MSLTLLGSAWTRSFQKYRQYQSNNLVICRCIFQGRETWSETSHGMRRRSKGFPTKRAPLTKFKLIPGWWWKPTVMHRRWCDSSSSGRWQETRSSLTAPQPPLPSSPVLFACCLLKTWGPFLLKLTFYRFWSKAVCRRDSGKGIKHTGRFCGFGQAGLQNLTLWS